MVTGDNGTSAAAPLWATLTAQFNVIFRDQGLPALGFYNDLLYIAAAIAPGLVQRHRARQQRQRLLLHGEKHRLQSPGLATSSRPASATTPTPGYDLVSGLGTPNGLLLARALAQIAHEQMYFDAIDPFLSADGPAAWRAGDAESLLIQASSTTDATVHLSLGAAGTTFFTAASDPFAWTARLAQQSLQADFDRAW